MHPADTPLHAYCVPTLQQAALVQSLLMGYSIAESLKRAGYSRRRQRRGLRSIGAHVQRELARHGMPIERMTRENSWDCVCGKMNYTDGSARQDALLRGSVQCEYCKHWFRVRLCVIDPAMLPKPMRTPELLAGMQDYHQQLSPTRE